MGNIGSDLKINHTKSGAAVLKFSLATNDYYTTSKGERVKETQWHRLVAWGKQAEYMADTLSKGSPISVLGKLTYNSFEGEDGQMKYYTEIKISEFKSLAPKAVEKEEAPF